MEIATAMSPVLKARIAGGFYFVTFIGSIYSSAVAPGTGPGHASGLIAGTANLFVTVLLFDLFRPVNRLIALLAVVFNLEGSAHEHDPLAFSAASASAPDISYISQHSCLGCLGARWRWRGSAFWPMHMRLCSFQVSHAK